MKKVKSDNTGFNVSKPISDGFDDANQQLGIPHEFKKEYRFVISYNFPGPLPLLPSYQSGCSSQVNAGNSLGVGRFCDYLILSAGTIVTIYYNEFQKGT